VTDTLAEVERIVRSICDEPVDLCPDTHLVADLGLDSVRQLDLVVQLENRFSIALEPEEQHEVITIAQLVAWIDRAREQVDTHA